MARRDGCDFQRAWMDLIDEEWKVVSISHQSCWFDDYSSMIHDLGEIDFEGRFIYEEEMDDLLVSERLVEEYEREGRDVRNLWEIVWEDGRPYVGDSIYDEDDSDEAFTLAV